MNLNTEAQFFLQSYRNEAAQTPWAFPGALKQSQLDGSYASLKRAEKLLVGIREKFNPTEAFLERKDVENCLRLLAYFLGDFIAAASGNRIDWYDREVAARLPVFAEGGLPEVYWTRVIALINGKPLFLMGLLIDHLTTGDLDIGIEEYVENQIFNLQSLPEPEESERATRLLQSVQNDDPIIGGLAYRQELKALGLDGSLENLGRLQALLEQIRAQKRSYDNFERFASRRHFLLFCAYYYANSIARHCDVSLKWYSYADAKATLDPEMPHILQTMTACVLGNRIYCPVSLICEILFAEHPSDTLLTAASKVIAQMPVPIIRLNAPSPGRLQVLRTRVEDDVLLQGFRLAGSFAASALGTFVADGGRCPPQLSQFDENGPRVIRDFTFMDNPLEAGLVTLDQNDDNKPYGVFVIDGYANLPEGRVDALIVDLRCHVGTEKLVKPAMRALFNLPYRPASHPDGFAVYLPVIQETSLTPAEISDPMDAFYLGLMSHSAPASPLGPAFTWDKFFSSGSMSALPA